MTAATATTTTPAKLRDGSWGARTTTPVQTGDTITITTKSGKTWDARVGRVIWTNGTACLVSTSTGAARTSRGPIGCRCPECDERITSERMTCWETGLYCADLWRHHNSR